jgi:hypothetical protein
MGIVHFESAVPETERRARLFSGDVFCWRARPSSLALISLAREMLAEAFAPLDPETAQHSLDVEKFAAILSVVKPRFIHDPRCKVLIPRLLADLGCDPADTFFDVPRLRSATSDGYLNSGIAYAFHLHRDTWYSAPMCQINWWLPVFELRQCNGMVIHPRYFDLAVANTSSSFDYQQWQRTGRVAASQQVRGDDRPQPRATAPVAEDGPLVLIPESGGIMAFSAAHLHGTLPNSSGVTRYSIDFRTVTATDVRNLAGATNMDSRCSGSTMLDYLNCTTFGHLADDIIAPYADGPPQRCDSSLASDRRPG